MASPSPEELAYMRAHADDDLRPNIYACVACCLIFPYIAVGLRFIARRRMNVPIKTDDYLALAALVRQTMVLRSHTVGEHDAENHTVTLNGNECWQHICRVQRPWSSYHLCKESHSIREGTFPRRIIKQRGTTEQANDQTFISGEVTYSCTIVLAKLSVLFLYRRLFPSKELTIYSILVAILVLGYSTALIVVSFTQCTPLYKLWRPETPGHCINTKAAYVTTGYDSELQSLKTSLSSLTCTSAMNVITDILILLLPLRFIWGLQMKTSRKLQIVGLFISGGM